MEKTLIAMVAGAGLILSISHQRWIGKGGKEIRAGARRDLQIKSAPFKIF